MVKNRVTLLCCAIAAVGLLASGSASAANQSATTVAPAGATVYQLNYQAPIHWVSVQQLAAELQDKAPINVGFDIDDTVLASSPGFYRGQQEFSPGNLSYLKNPAFWEKMNNGWDKFSIPKESARQILAMHIQHGDQIYFITGRPETKTEDLSELLQHDFSIPAAQMHKVIFAGDTADAKINHIKDNHITMFYGDSDNDITNARAAGAEGIRVLRTATSTNKPQPVNGSLGERVVTNSDY